MISPLELLDNGLSHHWSVTVPTVAILGLVATLRNPCALPLYPAVTSVCALERSVNLTSDADRRSWSRAFAFLLGLAMSTAALGLFAVAIGHVLGTGRWTHYLIGAIPLLMGMRQLGWLPAIWGGKLTLGMTRVGGMSGAVLTGLVTSLVITTCGGALLGAVLAYAAYNRAFLYGGVLLFAYGTGAGVTMLAFGKSVWKIVKWMDRKGLRKPTEVGLASLMIGVGLYLLWIA